MDWNDLHQAHGLDAVRSQLHQALEAANDEALPGAPSQGRGEPETQAQPRTHPPEGAGEVTRFGLRITLDDLLFHYRLVYGTDTAWDEKRKMQIKVSHLREAVGKDAMRDWQKHPARKISEAIVFDPSESHDPTLYVNLYEGFTMQPDPRGKAGCEKILQHVYRLCGGRDEDYLWLLKWLAYPLQHPGAKMATAVLVHGSEGTGKSLLFEGIIKRIYGEYGITIGQAQLEAQFTDWQSKRLFALAEEVVSRAEKAHYKGVLKHMVTGHELQINPKNLPLRQETNHINFVFLSNSTVPLELDVGDRRYFVMYCDDVPPLEHFQAIAKEMDEGGVEAFYHYLLHFPMDDFSAHSKPPLSNAKQELIESSLSQARWFVREWQMGRLDLPYQPAAVDDLWKAFLRWCEKASEFKVKKRWFCAELARDLLRDKRDINYPDVMDKHKTTNLFVPHEWKSRIGAEGWPKEVGELAREFHVAVKGKLKDEQIHG
jgi:putative DNA primase/helicase